MTLDDLTKSLIDLGWQRSERWEYRADGPRYFYRPLWTEWHNDHGYFTITLEIRDGNATISARYGTGINGDSLRPIVLTHPDIAPSIALLLGSGFLK